MTAFLVTVLAFLALAGAWALHRAWKRNVTIWLPAYLKGNWAGRRDARGRQAGGPVHVLFCIADHFEPGLGQAERGVERRRVEQWVRHYAQTVGEFRDADGRPPRHTFFFPAEQYRPELIEPLGELVEAGYAEVEVHLHHDNDTSEGLRRALLEFVERLQSHGHLGAARSDGGPRFGFVHGNWALDNSRPDGRWCGVNDELRVLGRCGCYADFTLPSAPSATQTRRINSIYYAVDDPTRPRSHDHGAEVRLGGEAHGDLMLIQGPLTVTWPGGKFGVLPRIETANLSGSVPVTPRRVASWVNTRVCVAGKPDWVFVKAHTHGCNESNWPVLFGRGIRALHTCLTEAHDDARGYRLHYVTAREMYNIVKAAEKGLAGDPGQYRDLEVLPPRLARGAASRRAARQETAR